MTPTSTAAGPARPSAPPASGAPRAARPALSALLAAGVMLLAVAAGIAGSRAPRPVPASAPANEFSAARAMTHVGAIARAPHPVGSAEHEQVRAYLEGQLRRLGLETQTQTTTSVLDGRAGVAAATVHNVVGRLRGTRSTGAVLLVAHYDAVPGSYGAADDGSGVAAILEAVRALRAGPPLANDVIVLFSDAEEVGLLGAAAFRRENPWVNDVGVVVNLEARGAAGPALLFQTSRGNGRLIAAAARSVRHPVGSSLMVEIYRRMPNDTDLTIFLRTSRTPALNVAFVGEHTHYHTPLDRGGELSAASLQHHGEYAMGLARAFGATDLRHLSAPDHVYFDFAGLGMVHYPAGLALPLALLAALAAVAAIVVAKRRGALSGRGVALGFGALLLSLALGAAVAVLGWGMVTALRPGLRWILQGDAYNADWWLLGFAGLVAALTFAVYAAFRRGAAADLAVAPLLVWAALALGTAVSMPGASYLFTWPLILAAVSVIVLLGRGDAGQGRALALALLAVPALLVFAPLVRMFETALGFGLLAAPLVLMVLLLALLAPQVEVLSRPRRGAPVLALLAVGILGLVAGLVTTRFGSHTPQPDSLSYLLNADDGKAFWASSDPSADAWTRQYLGATPRRRSLASEGGALLGAMSLASDAPALALPAPELKVLSDQAVGGGRRVKVHLSSPRGAQRLALSIVPPSLVTEIEVNGVSALETSPAARLPRQRILTYYAVPPEGIDVAFTVHGAGPLTLQLTDVSYGLPAVPGGIRPRPEGVISKPFIITDATLVTRTVHI